MFDWIERIKSLFGGKCLHPWISIYTSQRIAKCQECGKTFAMLQGEYGKETIDYSKKHGHVQFQCGIDKNGTVWYWPFTASRHVVTEEPSYNQDDVTMKRTYRW